MYRNLLLALVALFLAACGGRAVVYSEPKNLQNVDFDADLTRAFIRESYGDYEGARDAFWAMFERYKAVKFLEQALYLTLSHNLPKADELDAIAQKYLAQSNTLKRLSALYALSILDLKRAEILAKELLKSDDYAGNYELYADIMLRKNKPKEAIKYYKFAYKQVPNEALALKIVGVYALQNDTKSIKALLEDFHKMNGCTLKTCGLLFRIYFEAGDYESFENILLELYELSGDKNFILTLIDNLNQRGKGEDALKIAMRYDMDDDVKIFLYQNLKRFDEARALSLKLYQESKKKEHLLRAALFEFEAASVDKKPTLEEARSVAAKFEEAIDAQSEAIFLNYYGYLLIDYELDVKEGMKWVELALQKEPQNLYYLDSLAWGYYKLGECEKAWEIFEQTLHDAEFSNSSESKEHLQAIERCLR
ncbi:ATP-dependent nuclease subunit B [Campylobacter sp.]|uniref:tetratricopeptide repeat protein n=1 Tax=Campylobacter sp. TaxID=205 RepID=UPI0026DC72B3|nr:ATP-dependent nuclease subunit B [Campylobacter sp.]MDO4673783.1 ATP-dependent nuclease subunit B [Campylobacter sp.]